LNGMKDWKKKKEEHKDGLTQKDANSIESSIDGLQAESQEKEGVAQEIADLKKRLEEKEKEAKENYDRFLRMAADYENYKKRAVRDKEEWMKYANEDLIKAILPFMDNL